MSSWREYMKEKESINELIAKGYRVTKVTELFDGDDVRFERVSGDGTVEIEELRLVTADGRKYLGSVLIAQIRASSASVSSVS
jgi:hypothetical protein